MKTLKIIGIIIVSLLVIYIGYRLLGPKKNNNVLILNSQKPERGDIALVVTSTGTIQPVNIVSVGSQVSGIIKKLYVDYNSVVKAGQLLAELDRSLFEASLSQAKSNYALALSNQNFQEGNFSRQKQLFDVGAISKADYDAALNTYNNSKAQANASAAQVQTAEKNLSFTKIYSPINGTILSRSVNEGQTVAASFNTPTLFSIANDLTRMQVEASVDEADIGNVREGNRATFTVDAFVNDVFVGKVQQVRMNPTTTNNVVTYTTIIYADNKDFKLKPGMTANVTIYTLEKQNALLIPAMALKFRPDSTLSGKFEVVPSKGRHTRDESIVWVKEGNKIVEKPIKTGINNNTKVEVLDGLTANEEVVTNAITLTKKEAATQGQQRSPFMPQRPGGANRRR